VTRDDFDTWLADPVTRWVFDGIRNAQAQEKAEWIRLSWDAAPPNGVVSPVALIELRTRHDALGDMIENTYENWSEWNGDEPGDE